MYYWVDNESISKYDSEIDNQDNKRNIRLNQ